MDRGINRAWISIKKGKTVLSIRIDPVVAQKAAFKLHSTRGWTRLGSAIRKLVYELAGNPKMGRPKRLSKPPEEIRITLPPLKDPMILGSSKILRWGK